MTDIDNDIVGLLTVTTDDDGEEVFGFVSPDALYHVAPRETVPEAWGVVRDRIEADGKTIVFGVLTKVTIDGE